MSKIIAAKLVTCNRNVQSKVLRICHWRRFVAFFVKAASDEGLRSKCLARLLPTLLQFVNFVSSYTHLACIICDQNNLASSQNSSRTPRWSLQTKAL